jgi:hypothetical protein
MKLMFAGFTLMTVLDAQTKPAPPYFTNGFSNCRWFNNAGDNGQLGYIAGLGEAFAEDNSVLVAPPNSVTHGEVLKGIQAICSAPENAAIRTIDAYSLFIFKIKGVSEAALKDLATAARYYATHGEWPQDPEPKKAEPTKGRL